MNTQKSVAFYTLTTKNQKEKFKKNLIYCCIINNKYLGINLSKETKKLITKTM